MLLYKKLNVPNFENIRIELEKATQDKLNENLRFWDVPFEWFNTYSPIFYRYINLNKKLPIRLCRFYLTPKYDNLIPHVDGLSNYRSPIGLNIPIIGYKNTTMSWYSCPDDNLKDGKYGFNNINASRVIDFSKLKKIDTTVIDCPTFVRTDVVHGITNPNPTPRLVLSLRFPYTVKIGQNFEDAMNLSNF